MTCHNGKFYGIIPATTLRGSYEIKLLRYSVGTIHHARILLHFRNNTHIPRHISLSLQLPDYGFPHFFYNDFGISVIILSEYFGQVSNVITALLSFLRPHFSKAFCAFLAIHSICSIDVIS